MYQPLAPCPDCQRHVRVAESACPFCGAALSSGDLQKKVVPPANRRLSRGAAFVFGAAMAVTACGSDVESPGNTSGAGGAHDAGPNDDGGGQALYGVPEPDGGIDDGGGMALYGDPPPDDGGGSADYGAPPPDAGGTNDGGAQPLYGAPPPGP